MTKRTSDLILSKCNEKRSHVYLVYIAKINPVISRKLLVGHSCPSLWSQKNLRKLEDPLEDRGEVASFADFLCGWLGKEITW